MSEVPIYDITELLHNDVTKEKRDECEEYLYDDGIDEVDFVLGECFDVEDCVAEKIVEMSVRGGHECFS